MENQLLIYQRKRCNDLEHLRGIVAKLKAQGLKIVLTSGTFDILHVGHGRYLSLAKNLGDVLVVGLDSDEKVRARKGPGRPIVDQDERAEMLTYLEAVDYLYVKPLEDRKWALIQAICPDILVISKRSEYTEEEIGQLGQFCGSVQVLESQAETSTTARIRSLIISSVSPLMDEFAKMRTLVDSIEAKFSQIVGG